MTDKYFSNEINLLYCQQSCSSRNIVIWISCHKSPITDNSYTFYWVFPNLSAVLSPEVCCSKHLVFSMQRNFFFSLFRSISTASVTILIERLGPFLNSWPIKIVLLVRQIYFLKTLIRPLGTIFMGLYSMIRVSKINFGLKQFISALLNFGGRKRPFDSWDQILSLVKWNFQNTLFRWK